MTEPGHEHPARVSATPLAQEWLEKLKGRHGELMLFQSGGCCEGSAPLCMLKGEMKIGENDIKLGVIQDTEFFISASQFEKWKHTKIVLDVVDGGGNAFSLESPEGISFHIRSSVFTETELDQLKKA